MLLPTTTLYHCYWCCKVRKNGANFANKVRLFHCCHWLALSLSLSLLCILFSLCTLSSPCVCLCVSFLLSSPVCISWVMQMHNSRWVQGRQGQLISHQISWINITCKDTRADRHRRIHQSITQRHTHTQLDSPYSITITVAKAKCNLHH